MPIYIRTNISEDLSGNAELKLTVRKIVAVDNNSANVVLGKINSLFGEDKNTADYTAVEGLPASHVLVK